MELEGARIVVTGGAGHLGRAIAQTLARLGADIALVDRDDASLREAIGAIGTKHAFSCDLTDEEAVGRTVVQMEQALGAIDGLVNAVGRIYSAPLVNVLKADGGAHPLAEWDATISANLTAPFLVSAHVAQGMARSRTRGVIVNLSSVAAEGTPGQSAYAAAKAGVNAITKVWARELGPFGIRVVSVSPGYIDVATTHESISDGTVKELTRRTPLRRLGNPEEVAAAVVYAFQNDFVTGTVLETDGGLSV